jgi:hypothetical protein
MNFYSIEREIALGKQMAQEVERQAKIVNDPVVSEYVNRVGQNLVRNSDARVPFTIKVVDDEEINTFALPGGVFFVDTGVLLNSDNEAEMAGVMAHEIGQVAARHGTRQASRTELMQYGALPVILIGGMAGFAIYQCLGVAVPLWLPQVQPRFGVGSRLAGPPVRLQDGIRSNCLCDFFEKIESQEKKNPGLMSKLFAPPNQGSDQHK